MKSGSVGKPPQPSGSVGNLIELFVGPLSRVRPRNGILALVLLLLLPLRSEFIGEL